MGRLLFGTCVLCFMALPVVAEEDSDFFRVGFGLEYPSIKVDDFQGINHDSYGNGASLFGAYEFGNGWGVELGAIDISGLDWVANLLLINTELMIDDYSAVYAAPTYTWENNNWFFRTKLGAASWEANGDVGDGGLIFLDGDDRERFKEDGVDLFYAAEVGYVFNWFEWSLAYTGIQSDPVSARGFGMRFGFRF